MLGRYKIYRGKRPADDPQPDGIRQDCRWRTRHILRPDKDAVAAYLESPGDKAWKTLAKAYRALLAERFRQDREAFDALADLARDQDVFIGCNCPTKANPRVDRCHTYLALEFMQRKYRDLRVILPDGAL